MGHRAVGWKVGRTTVVMPLQWHRFWYAGLVQGHQSLQPVVNLRRVARDVDTTPRLRWRLMATMTALDTIVVWHEQHSFRRSAKGGC